jgi:hypothetical protein
MLNQMTKKGRQQAQRCEFDFYRRESNSASFSNGRSHEMSVKFC